VSQAIVDRLIDKLKYTVGSTGLRRMWIEKIEQQRSPAAAGVRLARAGRNGRGRPPTASCGPSRGQRAALAVRLLDAAWSEGRDITSDSVVHEVADTLSLNGRELLGKTHTDEIKQRLRLQTEGAIQAGVFGVPSFVVDGEIFWGNDRLHFLKAYLQGSLPTEKAEIEEILARPRAADRAQK
jgi:hypothetical protein